MNLTKRVIILDKVNSPMIAQAIFILKEGVDCEFSAVAEAEKIVEKFMADKITLRKKRRYMPYVLAGLFLTGFLLALINVIF